MKAAKIGPKNSELLVKSGFELLTDSGEDDWWIYRKGVLHSDERKIHLVLYQHEDVKTGVYRVGYEINQGDKKIRERFIVPWISEEMAVGIVVGLSKTI